MGVLAAALGALPTAAAEKTATASVHEIRLRNRTFVPVPVAALSAAAAANDERRRLIVQTEDIPLPARLAVMSGLRAKGARVMHTINSHAAMVSVPAGLDIAQTAGVRWTGSLDPSDKFEGSPGSRLLIEFFPDADDAEIASALSAAGVAPAPRRGLPRHVVYAESSSSGAILALAQAPSVAWILNASSAVVADEVFYYCPGAQGLYGPVADYVKGNDGWDGVTDEAGVEIKFDVAWLAWMLEDHIALERCRSAVFAAVYAEAVEGNASPASPDGGAKAGRSSAPDAEPTASAAPTAA